MDGNTCRCSGIILVKEFWYLFRMFSPRKFECICESNNLRDCYHYLGLVWILRSKINLSISKSFQNPIVFLARLKLQRKRGLSNNTCYLDPLIQMLLCLSCCLDEIQALLSQLSSLLHVSISLAISLLLYSL